MRETVQRNSNFYRKKEKTTVTKTSFLNPDLFTVSFADLSSNQVVKKCSYKNLFFFLQNVMGTIHT